MVSVSPSWNAMIGTFFGSEKLIATYSFPQFQRRFQNRKMCPGAGTGSGQGTISVSNNASGTITGF